jgi:hypothetical protein
MKMLMGVFIIGLSLNTQASTTQIGTFNYDGSQNATELILKAEKNHTKREMVERPSTCHRREKVGYRTACTNPMNPNPSSPLPTPTINGTCWRAPEYRRVSYPCSKKVEVSYKVKDYDVEARVKIDVTKLASEVKSFEAFKVILHGEELSLEVKGSKQFLVMLKHNDIRSNMNGSVKFIDAVYTVVLVPSAPVLAALMMKDLSFENDILKLDLEASSLSKNISFSLNVTQRARLRSDIVLLERELAPSEIEFNGTEAKINLNELGIKMNGGRYSITPKIKFSGEGELLNKSQFNELEVSRTLLLRL